MENEKLNLKIQPASDVITTVKLKPEKEPIKKFPE